MGNLSLVGPSNEGIAAKVESQRTVNWYPVRPEAEGERAHLRGRPGLQLLCTLPHAPIRGTLDFGERFFCVAGSRIYEVYSNGGNKLWGKIGSIEGKVSMAVLLDTVIIGDGSGYYSLTLATGVVAPITSAPRGRFCVFFNQRILYQGENGQVFYSELNDPSNVPGLNFFTAESLPDDVVAITTTEEQILLHGSDSTESWYDSGDLENPFQRIQGGVVYSGCGYPFTALRLDNSSWWIEKDKDGAGIVRRTQGNTPIRVSTSSIERFLKDATGVSAHSYQEEGETFYVINTDQGTRAYGIKAQAWHERAWLNPYETQERARPEYHAYALGGHIVTDYRNGNIYRQSLDYHSDNGTPIRRTRVSPHMDQSGKAMVIDELYLDFATGVGTDGEGQGTDPKVMLRVSKNGSAFGRERVCGLGRIGQFGKRVRFHRLGMGRDWLFEISVSDPVLSVLMSGDVISRPGAR